MNNIYEQKLLIMSRGTRIEHGCSKVKAIGPERKVRPSLVSTDTAYRTGETISPHTVSCELPVFRSYRTVLDTIKSHSLAIAVSNMLAAVSMVCFRGAEGLRPLFRSNSSQVLPAGSTRWTRACKVRVMLEPGTFSMHTQTVRHTYYDKSK